jgi:hypothetical protein
MNRKEILKRQPNMERGNGYGSYYLTCLYRGEKKRIHTHDSEFWDRFTSSEYQSREYFGMCRNIIKRFTNYNQVN